MKASPSDQRRLLDLAALDLRIQAATRAAQSPPQAVRIAELVAERARVTPEVAEARGRLEDARFELQRIESDVAVVQTRIARDAERLASSANAKQAQSLEHELGALERRRSDLEDAELIVMERIEVAEADLVDREQELAAIQQEGALASTAAKETVASAQADAATATRDRAAVASTVETNLLAFYERIAARGVGAALLRGSTCEGCRMVLAGSELSVLRAAADDEVVLCPECGCILVRTGESEL